jgi:hypothetical protein
LWLYLLVWEQFRNRPHDLLQSWIVDLCLYPRLRLTIKRTTDQQISLELRRHLTSRNCNRNLFPDELKKGLKKYQCNILKTINHEPFHNFSSSTVFDLDTSLPYFALPSLSPTNSAIFHMQKQLNTHKMPQ